MSLRILILCLFVLAQTGFAADGNPLYEAEVWVGDQLSTDERNAAIREALNQVAGRIVAGDENKFNQNSAVQEILAEASFYVVSFRYSPLPEESRSNNKTRSMQVLFDKNALLERFHNAGIAVWEEPRPELLIWLAVKDKGETELFNPEFHPDLLTTWEKAAQNVGLKLLFPLMDLEDQQIFSTDIQNAGIEQYSRAAERYNIAVVLSGKIEKKRNCWQSSWKFFFNNELNQWASDCAKQDEILEKALRGAYNRLSVYYAGHAEDAGNTEESERNGSVEITLKILGISDMNDMDLIAHHLESLKNIKSVDWSMVEGGVHYYNVRYQGSPEDLIKALKSGGILSFQDRDGSNPDTFELRLLQK